VRGNGRWLANWIYHHEKEDQVRKSTALKRNHRKASSISAKEKKKKKRRRMSARKLGKAGYAIRDLPPFPQITNEDENGYSQLVYGRSTTCAHQERKIEKKGGR